MINRRTLAEFRFEPHIVAKAGTAPPHRASARNEAIAAAIGGSGETIKLHIKSIFAKLGVPDGTEGVTAALAPGLIHLCGEDEC